MTDTRVRRTIMITPGHLAPRLAKAVTLDVDAVAFDIEDGVPPGEKAAARKTITEALGIHSTLAAGNGSCASTQSIQTNWRRISPACRSTGSTRCSCRR